MKLSPIHVALIAAIGVATTIAIVRWSSSTPIAGESPSAADAALLPNPLPISSGARLPSANDAPAAAWKVPAEWTTSPNTSSMRLATYRVPVAQGDAEETEVTVVRAGGTTDANIERWIGQFDEAGHDERTVKTVGTFKITLVEVSGTYLGGAMMPRPDAPGHKGWSLLGAVVETPTSPYFFKMTGPTASVKAAQGAFIALLDSLTPP